jgi:uncharacterized protein (TIGR02145 family)
MRVGRVVKAMALLALLVGVSVAGMKYAAVAEARLSTFTDGRDGKKYKTTAIDGKRWMAENLNIKTEGSWCYDNKEYNCEKYGRLYNWNAAKTACPAGWHLPSRKEWGNLAEAAGGRWKYGTGGKAGKKLKAKSGWNEEGNGADGFGFSALPGGYRDCYDGNFYRAGKDGDWWTATEYDSGIAWKRTMVYIYYIYDEVFESGLNKRYGFSVRCLRD